jgi:3-oxoacyl-[acyl-carrier-protein] synthase II
VSAVGVTGCGVLCSAGAGLDALVAALSASGGGVVHPGYDVEPLFAERLPSPKAHVLLDFDVRQHLGRKGTSFYDRATGLALVCAGHALVDSGLRLDEETRDRTGVVFGTSGGSLKSMSDFTRETLVEERPYLVNPALFPNTVMNCAAAQAAIRFGLRGINTTLAAGQLALIAALGYASRTLRRGYAAALLVGAVEEFTPHRAWATYLAETKTSGLPVGEGAGVFVIERADVARREGRHVDAEVLAAATAFCPGGEHAGGIAAALDRCIRRVLAAAAVRVDELALVLPGAGGQGPRARIEQDALAAVLGGNKVETIHVTSALGDCDAASGALQLAAVVARHRAEPERDGRLSLVTASTAEGGVAAAVIRGWSRDGARRG